MDDPAVEFGVAVVPFPATAIHCRVFRLSTEKTMWTKTMTMLTTTVVRMTMVMMAES